MYNFPIPYPDELLYSTIARAGIRMGITSPKQLLDEIFGDRKIIATTDLPGHLSAIARHYPRQAGLSVETLAYAHTLFPLYAPFVPEERRQQCLKLLGHSTRGAVHLGFGIATSRIKQVHALRACPECVEGQITQYGEPYWKRDWQVRGADACPRHGRLVDTRLSRYPTRRHTFEALTTELIQSAGQNPCPAEDIRVAKRTRELLDMPPRSSPTYDQWSQFYEALAADHGCARGKHKIHGRIRERILKAWPQQWLENVGLSVIDTDSCWLRSMFRKHRKVVSYLEHIIVLDAFLKPEWSFQAVLQQVTSLPRARPVVAPPAPRKGHIDLEILKKRHRWESYLKRYGVTKGRRLGGGPVYAALYRCDREWLLRTNKLHRARTLRVTSRVDWMHRDRKIFEKLCDIKWSQLMKSDSPRHSKRWYLAQTGLMTTATKHMGKLPLTAAFLTTCSEPVERYQVRRIRLAMQTLASTGLPLKRWRILRTAGLSEVRLKTPARNLLDGVE